MTDEELSELKTAGKIVLGAHDWYPDGKPMADALLEELRDGSFRVICYGCKRESWHVETPQAAYDMWLTYWKPPLAEVERLRAKLAHDQAVTDAVLETIYDEEAKSQELYDRMKAENAALREIARGVAAIGADASGDYSHEESAPWIQTCPACFRKIGGYDGGHPERGRHAENCPIRQARALLGDGDKE